MRFARPATPPPRLVRRHPDDQRADALERTLTHVEARLKALEVEAGLKAHDYTPPPRRVEGRGHVGNGHPA